MPIKDEDYIEAEFILTSSVTVRQHKILLDTPANYSKILLRLDVSNNLDRSYYVNPDTDMPTTLGINAMIKSLTASLTVVLKTAAKAGVNDGKLLSDIISELQNGFVDLREVEVETIPKK